MKQRYTSLEDLGDEDNPPGETEALEHVIECLRNSEELHNDLEWETKIWDSVTIEELIGGLIQADNLLREVWQETYRTPDKHYNDEWYLENVQRDEE